MNNELAVTGGKGVHDNARECTISNEPVAPQLTQQQQSAIELLVQGQSLVRIAHALSIDASTLYRWRQGKAFDAALGERRNDLWKEAIGRLKSLVHPALDVTEALLKNCQAEICFPAAVTVLRISGLTKALQNSD